MIGRNETDGRSHYVTADYIRVINSNSKSFIDVNILTKHKTRIIDDDEENTLLILLFILNYCLFY